MLFSLIAVSADGVATPLAQGGAPEIPWVRIIFVLILCVGIAFAAVGFIRLRYGLPFLPDRFVNPVAVGQTQRDDTEKLVIIERVSAGPASQFIILARGKQRYLLHLSQHGITEIDRFSDDKPDATT